MIKRENIFYLALATLLGFGLAGWGVMEYLQEVSFLRSLAGKTSITYQALTGIAYGSVAALVGWKIVELPYLKSTKNFFIQLIRPLKLSVLEIVFISLCAGIGEEIFFRGAIQPYLGVWITSVLFVAMHGYLNPFNLKISVYGVFMTVVIAGLGYLTIHMGLLSAIVAHTFVDIILLYKLSNSSPDLEKENMLS
ncbi:CPBP family intramembrane metalloprotease [Fulvivirgaceae bacterium BMA12]|uniref:CPBP family intramembrane metalloprotease n=1 Tax=Agaribacillus aureus TaxID=3051825 RepID=A0ABT8L5G2_9BACT|nr:CPBP family intramembrane metalloprotease [Fulvivirgaceae bacterium BMA12]